MPTLVAERIETDRLVLVPVEPATAYAVLAGDPARAGLRAGAGWPHRDTMDGLRLSAEAGLGDPPPAWFVTLDGAVVGDCGVHGGVDPDGRAEIGYGLAAPYRGRGLGGEVVRGLTAWLVAQPGVTGATAETTLENLPSRRALERAGYVVDSTDGRVVRYVRRRP